MITVIILALAMYVLYRALGGTRVTTSSKAGKPVDAQIAQLTESADRLRNSNRYHGAEKAYLEILKLDHKHAPTYGHLGSLYATMKNYDDAIECCQIASQLAPSAATNYNLGLALYDNKNYVKAIAAFEKSLIFEPSVQRFVALAKSYEKLGSFAKTAGTLEHAVALEPENARLIWLYVDALGTAKQTAGLPDLYVRLKKLDPRNPRLKQLEASLPAVKPTSVESLPTK